MLPVDNTPLFDPLPMLEWGCSNCLDNNTALDTHSYVAGRGCTHLIDNTQLLDALPDKPM